MALGGCDRAGWMQDLCLYFDLQWNTKTGKVGPARYFIAPLILESPFDCRELDAPQNLSVRQVLTLIESVTGFYLHGPTPIKAAQMKYRTGDISIKAVRAAKEAHKKFKYCDRTARCGKLYHHHD